MRCGGVRMTLTRFQIHERLGGLAGEMKAARELDRINADTLAAKEHELTLAAQAKEKSEANITRLEEEARSLATQYASSVEELINGPTAGDDGISVTNIFENPVYTNGISRALDAAQNP